MTLALALAFLCPQEESVSLARHLRTLREQVARSVVAIDVQRTADPDGQFSRGQFSEHADYYNRPKGPTSGVIYEADGLILTSYFNVSGEIRKEGIKVTLANGKEYVAELLGFDEQRDVALLKIAEKDLPVLPKADPNAVGQGTFVAVVGRSPDKAIPTINLGIVSAVNRMNKAAVQTDAEMNYGNAGGALVTMKGELVGVGCNVKPRNVWGQSGGIGFACKTAEIDKVLPRLKNREKIAAENRPYLGIQPGEGNPDVEGVQIAEVVSGSPADKAGIKKDDVIVEFGGKKITDFESLREQLGERKIGETVTVKVKRLKDKDKKEYDEKEFKVKLEGRPEP